MSNLRKADRLHQRGALAPSILIRDMRLGLAGEFCEVFISSKAQSMAGPVNREPQTKSLQHANR